MFPLCLSVMDNEIDQAALESIYEEYKLLVFRAARRVLGNDPDAEDAAQDAWCRVAQNFSKIHMLPRNKLGAYLVIVSRNAAVDVLRKNRDTAPLPEERRLCGAPFEEEAAARLDLAAQLQALELRDRVLLEQIESYISGLDLHTQAVFRLRLFGERSFPEIAAALEEPEAAVKSRYYRLLGRLRKEFDPDG